MSLFSFAGFSKLRVLRGRVFFTLCFLFIYRLGAYVPLPGLDMSAVAAFLSSHKSGFLGMFDMLSGGALGRMSVFALSIFPYISASIIMQLLSFSVPYFEDMRKDYSFGKAKMMSYTRFLSFFIALIQAYGVTVGLRAFSSSSFFSGEGGYFIFVSIATLVTGFLFLLWLAEQITLYGVGNGTSLIIFSGIVSNFPSAFLSFIDLVRNGVVSFPFAFSILALFVGMIFFIIFFERAYRAIALHSPSSNKMFGGQKKNVSHLPLKLNASGMIPPIFSGAILSVPMTFFAFFPYSSDSIFSVFFSSLTRGHILYLFVYVFLIFFFSFFYSSVVFKAEDTAESLKKHSAVILGIRPGNKTAEYLAAVAKRLAFWGACYLSFVSLFPEILISYYSVPFYFGGTSLLIVVTVAIDTFSQIHSYLISTRYSDFLKEDKK